MKRKMSLRSLGTICLALVIMVTLASVALGAEWSPKKPIKYVSAVSPGGGIDTTMRGIVIGWSKILGQHVVVKNMPGAGGRLMTSYLFRSKPDGYTVGCSDPVTTMSAEFLMKTDYKFEDFPFIGRVSSRYYGLAVGGNSPHRSIEDLQKAAKARPKGKPLRIGGIGLATANAVNALLCLPKLNIPFTYIGGMKGSAEAMVGCVRGDLDMIFYPVNSYIPYLETGDLRIIFSCSPKRLKVLPDVPTVRELGYPQVEGLSMSVVAIGPPGLPENIRSVLEKTLVQAGDDSEVIAYAKRTKIPIEIMSAKDYKPELESAGQLLKDYPKTLEAYKSWQKP